MLPIETILAVFPAEVVMGNISIRPLTLYHAAAMESMGIDLGHEIGRDRILIAAWMMSMTADEVYTMMTDPHRDDSAFEKWCNSTNIDVDEAMEEVNNAINGVLAVNVPGNVDEKQMVAGPRGFGWELELGEAVSHEYSIPFHEAMKMPLQRIFGLIACCRQRNGGKAGGPDYYERIMLKGIKDFKRRLENGGLN